MSSCEHSKLYVIVVKILRRHNDHGYNDHGYNDHGYNEFTDMTNKFISTFFGPEWYINLYGYNEQTLTIP